MYKRETLDLIVANVDPLDVFNFCGLKPSSVTSKEIRSNCPIHEGDNPSSFSFDRTTKIFTCFSHSCCQGRRRDIITFLMEVRKCSFREAIEILAKQAGIDLEDETPTEEEMQSYSYISECSKEYYSQDKFKVQECRRIRIRNRYADGLEFLEQYLESPERNSSLEQVKTFGIYPGLDKYNCLRAYIPIHDEKGRLVGLTGRKMEGVLSYPDIELENGFTKPAPKYDNLGGFKKASILYNLHRAEKFSKKGGLIVVEGQFDAIRMWNYGYKNVVASMGPILSDQQVALLYRYCTKVLLLVEDYLKVDPETGKILSMENLAKNLEKLKYGMHVEVAYLVKDPDSSSKEEVDTALHNAELIKRI